MGAPIYTGDAKPCKFDVTDADGAVNPSSVAVEILKPTNSLLDGGTAGLDGNVVTYTVSGNVTDEEGIYKVYFICTLSYGERTHKIMFPVVRNPELNR
jgi:hypothetical protein